MAKKKLGILLSTPPEHKNKITAVALANVSIAEGITTYLYLIDDGVYNINHPEINALAAAGVHLFACAYGAKRRNISLTNNTVAFSGLVVLSDLIKGCDRFITLN